MCIRDRACPDLVLVLGEDLSKYRAASRAMLAEQNFLAGEAPSLADVAVYELLDFAHAACAASGSARGTGILTDAAGVARAGDDCVRGGISMGSKSSKKDFLGRFLDTSNILPQYRDQDNRQFDCAASCKMYNLHR